MENRNIQEILEKKIKSGFLASEDARVFSPIFGDCFLRSARISDGIVISNTDSKNTANSQQLLLRSDGRAYAGGALMIFPSEKMCNWSKFAWEKYTLLRADRGKSVVFFNSWESTDYTRFVGFDFFVEDGFIKKRVTSYATFRYVEADAEFAKMHYIGMCHRFNGEGIPELEVAVPLYLDALGDYVQSHRDQVKMRQRAEESRKALEVMTARDWAKDNYPIKGRVYCFNLKSGKNQCIARLGCVSEDGKMLYFENLVKVSLFSKRKFYHNYVKESTDNCANWRLADEREMIILEHVITKIKESADGKYKNEPLPFKTKDWCLMRNSDDDVWYLCQFAYDASNEAEEDLFIAVGGGNFYQCISYEGNEKLLGTSETPAHGKK